MKFYIYFKFSLRLLYNIKSINYTKLWNHYKNHLFSLLFSASSAFYLFFLSLHILLFLVTHREASIRWIGPNEPRSRGRTNRSCIGISTIRRIWVRAVRNSSPSFLPHVSDPFPPSDPPRSIDPDSWLLGLSLFATFLRLSFLHEVCPPTFPSPPPPPLSVVSDRQYIMSYCTQSVRKVIKIALHCYEQKFFIIIAVQMKF